MDELTLQLLRDLYEREYQITDQQGNPIEFSPAGSLSLLALGYKGTVILRKIRGWKLENNKLVVNLEPYKNQENETN